MACDPFDPLDWLRRFKDAGGWYIVQDEKIWTGWQLFGNPHDGEAREIWREIECDDGRRAMVREIVAATAPSVDPEAIVRV